MHRKYKIHMSRTLGKQCLMHVRKVSSQIREDTFHFNCFFCLKGVSFSVYAGSAVCEG